MPIGTTVIADVINSRKLPEREWAQHEIARALDETNNTVMSREPLRTSVGDEAQGVYDSLNQALLATMLVRLILPKPIDCRFGIGSGTYTEFGTNDFGKHQDGPAWWAARDAIDEVKRRQTRNASAHTWYEPDATSGSVSRGTVNAYLLARDHVITRMSDRSRTTLIWLLKEPDITYTEIADREHISPSAISQAAKRDGLAGIVSGVDELRQLVGP